MKKYIHYQQYIINEYASGDPSTLGSGIGYCELEGHEAINLDNKSELISYVESLSKESYIDTLMYQGKGKLKAVHLKITDAWIVEYPEKNIEPPLIDDDGPIGTT
jgi:hypothetical protein